MGFGLRSAAVALALTSLVSSPSWAGDDGAAPLWQGIGSIFGPVVGFTGLGGGEKPPPIEYREHGKLVLPPNTELPPPISSATADPAWPVNQEILRKKALQAFSGMMRELKSGGSVVVTADVPKIARIAGLGIVTLAKHSQCPIVPVAMATAPTRPIDVIVADDEPADNLLLALAA